jgi:SAM-dependent methyltransferase
MSPRESTIAVIDPLAQGAAHSRVPPGEPAGDTVAALYNAAGDDYIAYADGDPTRPFAFDGAHAHADRLIWNLLDGKLTELRASGRRELRLLDAGCGPGTWLRRLVTRAHALGFTHIKARGFDVAQAQIQRARLLAGNLSRLPGVDFTFDVADLSGALPEPDACVDIALCLYSVLSHLPEESLRPVADEFARATSGHFIMTVRAVGSPPSALADPIENVRRLKRDAATDLCEIELCDGRRAAFRFHLFGAAELRDLFAGRFDIEELRALDLFHHRFTPDPRWSPQSLAIEKTMSAELARLEEAYARHPEFIDHATHLLLVARPRSRGAGALPRRAPGPPDP